MTNNINPNVHEFNASRLNNLQQQTDKETSPFLLQIPYELLIKIAKDVATGPNGAKDGALFGRVCALAHLVTHENQIASLIFLGRIVRFTSSDLPIPASAAYTIFCQQIDSIKNFDDALSYLKTIKLGTNGPRIYKRLLVKEGPWLYKKTLFQSISEDQKTTELYNIFIKVAGENCQYDDAKAAFERATSIICRYNAETFDNFIKAAKENGNIQEAEKANELKNSLIF